MENLYSRLKGWVHTVVQYKPTCNVYYKNEKIFSCKSCNEAEQHIKRMYRTVSNDTFEIKKEHKDKISHPEELSCWKKFRSSFKISND